MMDLAAAQPPELLPELLVVAHFDANDESSKDRQASRVVEAPCWRREKTSQMPNKSGRESYFDF